MTAEIAIMNREAVALASDSAVTMRGRNREKIFTSANKIFRLSHYHPVGIMIYGNAGLLQVPWDTIIKIYRKKLGKKRFNTLKDYTNHFIKFLENGNPLFPISEQDNNFVYNVSDYFGVINNVIFEQFNLTIKNNGSITDGEIKQIISDIIGQHYTLWDNTAIIPSISEENIKKIANKFGEAINKEIKETFKDLPLSKYQHNQLKKIAVSLFTKILPPRVGNTDISGIVIAGFGEKDTFPSIEGLSIEGIVNDKLIYLSVGSSKIDYKKGAVIVPFAQTDMVKTFMEGIAPGCKQFQESFMSKIFEAFPELIIEKITKYSDIEKSELKDKLKKVNSEILKKFNEELDKFIRKEYVNPVIGIVKMLPKDELAVMAETLVNLTSFKRKVSNEVETVGGPIDVAIISKGDGFIWIKRKHYFKPELNPQFFENYYKEVENGKKRKSEI